MSLALAKLLEELTAGRLRVVDLTQPLSPQTPLLPLPPQFNNTPAFRIWELSRYDDGGPACVIDISSEVARNPNYLLTPERIRRWEEQHGRIPASAWVLLRTDWSKRKDPKDYINLMKDGPHTPGLAKESSAFLAQQRDVLGVGVETVGTDAGQAASFDPPFPNHYLMHGSGKFGLAGLSNLDRLPPTGAVVVAAPLKIVGGSGSPLRVIAI